MARAKDEAAVIKGQFNIYKSKFVLDITLTHNALKCQCLNETEPKVPEISIPICDIIGCACMKGNTSDSPHSAFVTHFYYQLKIKGKKKKIQRHTLTFEVSKFDTFDKNLEVANQWRTAVYFCIAKSSCEINASNLSNAEVKPNLHHLLKKKVAVFVNPNSGSGTARQMFFKKVKSVLSEADIQQEVIITERCNQVKELMEKMDLNVYAGIVIVSGDGLIYELYNGLLQRQDWKTAIQTPVGVIPGGSGNGLARSIAHILHTDITL